MCVYNEIHGTHVIAGVACVNFKLNIYVFIYNICICLTSSPLHMSVMFDT